MTVDLVADLAVINPFDFFLEESAERYPFRYEPWLALELAPYLVAETLGERFETYLAGIDRGERPTTAFVFELNAALQHDDRLRHPDGARHSNAGRNARETLGLVSRFGLAAGATVAPPRARRAVRIRLSHPTQARRHGARRARPERATISPICTPGAKCICPAPDGWGSIPPRGCLPAKDTSRWPARRTPSRRRRFRAPSIPAK